MQGYITLLQKGLQAHVSSRLGEPVMSIFLWKLLNEKQTLGEYLFYQVKVRVHFNRHESDLFCGIFDLSVN